MMSFSEKLGPVDIAGRLPMMVVIGSGQDSRQRTPSRAIGLSTARKFHVRNRDMSHLKRNTLNTLKNQPLHDCDSC